MRVGARSADIAFSMVLNRELSPAQGLTNVPPAFDVEVDCTFHSLLRLSRSECVSSNAPHHLSNLTPPKTRRSRPDMLDFKNQSETIGSVKNLHLARCTGDLTSVTSANSTIATASGAA